MPETSVNKETIRRMMQEFGCMELTEEELDAAVPILQAYAQATRQFDGVDLSSTVSGRIISLYPKGDNDGS